MTDKNPIITGGCLCGAVRYSVSGSLRNVINCHCRMCQRLHGSVGAYSNALNDAITITQSEGLSWYQSSKKVRRGFCHQCGANLFWKPSEQDSTSIVAGSFDHPMALKTVKHIFVEEKADFFEIHDDLPQFQGFSKDAFKEDSS